MSLLPAVNDHLPTKDTLPDRYWSGDGRRIVRKLTGCSYAEAGKVLGKFRSVATGNLAAVLDALLAAERDDIPGHALWGYVTSGIQARLAPGTDRPPGLSHNANFIRDCLEGRVTLAPPEDDTLTIAGEVCHG